MSMLTVQDYLAKINLSEILYVNKIPLDKVVSPKINVYNPMTLKYKNYWKEEIKKCIDGFWVEHNKEYKFVPGPLYFYGSFWYILLNDKDGKSKSKKLSKPMIRDLEWIKFYLYMEARGFSGFEDDDIYTCHREVNKLPEDRTSEFISKSCYNKKGEFKKYIPAKDYLWKYFSRPLGKPLYDNMALNVVDLESRGTGKSFTMSVLVGHNFTFDGAQDFEEFWNSRKSKVRLSSETIVGAIDSKYSGDLIKKIKLGLENFEGEFVMGNKVVPPPLSKSYSGQWEAGKTIIQEVEKKIGGQWKRTGSRSKIQHRTFMDNEFAATGTRGSLNTIEEIGFVYNLIEILGQMKECTADGVLKFGTIWMSGTGGDMEGGSTTAVMKVFYDPENYDCITLDDSYEGTGKKIGFFIPAWMGLNQFKDELGNTNYKAALQYILNIRAKLAKGKERDTYDYEICQRPILPSEVFLISGGNILPTAMLKDQLGNLEASNNPEDIGVFGRMKVNNDGKPEFVIDLDNELVECSWPVKEGENHTGGIRIWESPNPNAGYGYYLAGLDPYDHDSASSSVSLGSILIMKRASPGVSPYDCIVAEYTARPATARENYEQIRLLLLWYNVMGTCLYENEKIGIKTYLENHNMLFLLASTPAILKSNIGSKVDRKLGQHMNGKVKDEAELMLRDWLVAPAGEGKLNLHNIKSKPLLKELINYNKLGNFDRVIALMLCIIQITQMYKIVSNEIKEEVEKDLFFERQLSGFNFGNFAFNNLIGNNFN